MERKEKRQKREIMERWEKRKGLIPGIGMGWLEVWRVTPAILV